MNHGAAFFLARFCRITALLFPEFYLVDISERFPELKRRPGLTTWKATNDRSLETIYESFQAFKDAKPDWQKTSKMMESHWPPANAEELGLQHWYAAFE